MQQWLLNNRTLCYNNNKLIFVRRMRETIAKQWKYAIVFVVVSFLSIKKEVIIVNKLNFSSSNKKSLLKEMAAVEFDVLVIGGGITGCGIALDTVTRGLKTALAPLATASLITSMVKRASSVRYST